MEANLFTQCRHKNHFQKSFKKTTMPSLISQNKTSYVRHCIDDSGNAFDSLNNDFMICDLGDV